MYNIVMCLQCSCVCHVVLSLFTTIPYVLGHCHSEFVNFVMYIVSVWTVPLYTIIDYFYFKRSMQILAIMHVHAHIILCTCRLCVAPCLIHTHTYTHTHKHTHKHTHTHTHIYTHRIQVVLRALLPSLTTVRCLMTLCNFRGE